MPVLTKINTNSIAEDAITGDKFAGDAYLSNTANQNISGTYSENRLYTSDAYTLSGNATVNSHITLSTVKPTGDVVLTAGGAYTLTGTGVLSGGSLLAKMNTDASTLTGALGSAVTGSPNLNLSNATHLSGSIRQVKAFNIPNYAATNVDFNIPHAIGVGFDNPMSNSSNSVVLFFSVNSESYDTSTTSHWYGYWNGGSFPSLATSSSNRFADAVHYGHDGTSIRCQVGATEIDTNPGSLNPLYSVHVNLGSSLTAAFTQPRLVLMELHP